jgi:hypothetical protein
MLIVDAMALLVFFLFPFLFTFFFFFFFFFRQNKIEDRLFVKLFVKEKIMASKLTCVQIQSA